jgi:Na+-exporting ATPase
MMVYGLWMAALCLASFTIVLFGFGDGHIGDNCNNRYSEGCNLVFRARATCFTAMTWFSLFLAIEMMDLRRSFFRMTPGSKHWLTQWARDLWENRFLFWSIVAGVFTIFPILYIPGLNRVVFRHEPISWEWGVVFVATVLFFAGVEAWKLCKRLYFRRQTKKKTGGVNDLETRVFGRYLSMGRSDSEGDVWPEDKEKKKRRWSRK